MAQKVNKPAPAPTIITVTLPEEDKLLRTGQILIQRGTLATLRQFDYTGLEDIMNAIQDSATWLIQVEANPPDVTPAASRPPAAAASPDQGTDDSYSALQEASTAQDEDSEVPETAEESADGSQTPPEGEGVQADQRQLF